MSLKGLFVFFLFFSFGVFAQETSKQYAFRSLTVEEGLSQNSVVSIAQDSIGYMWFATQDGLNKYDGKTFATYNKQFEDVTRPSYSRLGKVYIDQESRVWIISNSGNLELYNDTLDSFEAVKKEYQISSVFQDSLKQFYIGTYDKGLYRIDSETKDTLQVFKNQDVTKTVYDFLQQRSNVLVATSGSVISIFNNSYSEIPIEDTSNINFSSLENTDDQTIWAGSFGKGLFYKKSEEETLKQFNGFANYSLSSSLNIQDLLVDKRNRLWVTTYGDGVYLVDTSDETIQHFLAKKDDPFALHYNDVLCVYEDYTGTVWLGTDGSGISYYDEHLVKFNVLTSKQVPENINVDVIRSIAVDTDEAIWLGTSGKGLTKVNTKTELYETYTIDNSDLSSNRIMSLLLHEEELWIGHQGQGLQIKNVSGEFRDLKELENQAIWKIYKDKSNQVWLCTRDFGLLQFDKKNGIVEHYTSENSALTSNNIRTIETDNNNNLWIGTEDNGLFVLNTVSKQIKKIENIPYKIKSLCFKENILWIGTNGNGIVAYDTTTKSVEAFAVDYGLPNNVIYAISPDSEGNLWLSSNKGITRFNPNHKSKHYVENFSRINGLQAFEYNTGAYFKDVNRKLYFGGIDGLNWFNPNTITYNLAKPKTVISKFEVFGEEEDIVQNSTFQHYQNTMTFTFVGMHFSEPNKNDYRYQLINHDPDWTTPSHNNVAHYTNLPPDDYTFKVISSNYEGIWNKEATTFSFKILKPWYATNMALFIYGLLTLLSIYTIYRYFKFRWDVKMQLQLEHAETERLKKIDEFKTKLYTNISHEFRTPLTLISGPIEQQLAKPDLEESDRKELSLVKQNANRLLNLVNQMLDLSLIDSGQIQLKVSQGNLTVLLKQLVAAFQYKADEKQMIIKANIQSLDLVWFDKDVMEKIVSNLLSNAIKYAPSKSEVLLDTSKQEDTFVFSVINTNKNIKQKDLGKLFQRFYQNDLESDGVGVGLALVKELVTLSKGSIIANNLEDNKIQFTVSLPIHKTAFLPHEIIEQAKAHQVKEAQEIESDNKNQSVILVVEDDPDIRSFVSSIFNTNYKVLEAANGEEGVELALEHVPDIIISDIMMPVLDGIELCNTIKFNKLTSHIPIILLTAKVGEEHKITGLKSGADAYITKPFNNKLLRTQVEQLIANRIQLKKLYSEEYTIAPELAITSTEKQFLNNLKEVLDEHITNPAFKSEDLSKHLHLSRTHLHRKLKAVYGLSTSEFMRSQRVKLATILLKESDATVSEIAYQIGFNSASYFIKSFKEMYNQTPSDYRLYS